MKYEIKCKICGKLFEIECSENSYNKGNYRKCCSPSCSNKRIHTNDIKEKISSSVKKYYEEHKFTYICEKCGREFKSNRTFKKGRHIHCEECIQQRKHYKENPQSILDLSKRTISKILERANKGCAICGWNESTCDIHHIIERSKGGTNNLENLIVVCPNCHRVIHSNKKYSVEYLTSKNIINDFPNWKDYYYISN